MIKMPYQNEHACRLIDPKTLKMVGSQDRKHEGKTYRILFGVKPDGGSVEQAYRYPIKGWTEAAAAAHCKDHKGSFEAASGEKKLTDFSYYPISDQISEIILKENNDKIQIPFIYKGKKKHAIFGDFEIDDEKFDLIIQNFNDGNAVLKDESGVPYLNINYNHPGGNETDPEKLKSAGRIYGFVKNGDRLDAIAWFTDQAKEYIQKKELNHISAEFAREWDDENGKTFKWVGLGAALTPKPFLKQNQIAIAMNDECVVLCTQNKENETMIQLNDETVKKLKLTEGKEIEEILKLRESADEAVAKLTDAEKTAKEQGEKIQSQDAEIVKLREQAETLTKAKGVPEGMTLVKDEDIKFMRETSELVIKLQGDAEKRDAVEFAQAQVKAGKIVPAQIDFVTAYFLKDREACVKYFEAAKPVLDLKVMGSEGAGDDKDKKPSVKLTEAIKAYQAEVNKDRPADQQISFAEADRILRQTKPDLYAEYYS
jgi:hypothetical protein